MCGATEAGRSILGTREGVGPSRCLREEAGNKEPGIMVLQIRGRAHTMSECERSEIHGRSIVLSPELRNANS